MPVSGQYAVGESELADIGRGRCSAAGVAGRGALGDFRQRRPAADAENTQPRIGRTRTPRGPDRPLGGLRRRRACRHVAQQAGRLEGRGVKEGLL
jgi:hypothetical protein